MLEINSHIEIPSDKLRDAIKLAYQLSSPQGLGILHFQQGKLDEETVNEIERLDGQHAASMDYVYGRSCKFHIYREEDKLYIQSSWYDHSDYQLEQLLTGLGIDDPAAKIAEAQENHRLANEEWKRQYNAG